MSFRSHNAGCAAAKSVILIREADFEPEFWLVAGSPDKQAGVADQVTVRCPYAVPRHPVLLSALHTSPQPVACGRQISDRPVTDAVGGGVREDFVQFLGVSWTESAQRQVASAQHFRHPGLAHAHSAQPRARRASAVPLPRLRSDAHATVLGQREVA